MSDNFLNISLIQTDLFWEDPAANLATFEEKISTLRPENQLVILPEMFNAGFSMNYSEPVNFTTYKWMKSTAQRNQIHLIGSAAITEMGSKYNRALIYKPNEGLEYYDKKHLFSLGSENLSFSPGNTTITTEINAWKIRPLICYDLRFPAWCRNQFPYYDVLVFIASWPEKRIKAWTTLLKARAIENQCYVIGVNRIGTDGNGLIYNGQSAVYDFNGDCIAFADQKDTIIQTSLSLNNLKNFRKDLPFLEDSDTYQFK
jgi:predicted amidohydrolase